MQKYKLQSSLPERANSKVVLPHAGVTEFDENGETEVELKSEAHLEHLLKSISDLHLPVENPVVKTDDEDTINPQTEENELGKSEDEKNDIGGGKEDDSSFIGSSATNAADELAAQLEALKVTELKQLASDSGFPEDDWKALKKEELKAYLQSKLQQA